METLFTQIAAQIYIARLKQWPEADTVDQVKESVNAAKLIIDRSYSDGLKAQLHNLQQDHDALRKQYDSAMRRIGEYETTHDMAGK